MVFLQNKCHKNHQSYEAWLPDGPVPFGFCWSFYSGYFLSLLILVFPFFFISLVLDRLELLLFLEFLFLAFFSYFSHSIYECLLTFISLIHLKFYIIFSSTPLFSNSSADSHQDTLIMCLFRSRRVISFIQSLQFRIFWLLLNPLINSKFHLLAELTWVIYVVIKYFLQTSIASILGKFMSLFFNIISHPFWLCPCLT